ncbi:nuclease-related domain-containing protein [Ramlibacter albus]|uniref:NERD domain-containing protein n=1 Tax=Ramlibacter albus TaxID=2079448 RepID=A0A923S5M3_9BURK|nr:nuclease-related domain-containing protein [Ramlibacter albus]MBC5768681.1 NERD domain-containing protein [Ramlibacter albus]
MTILKELEPRTEFKTIFDEAGYRAEQQMAFYFSRYFARDKKVLVFNDAKILARGELAQIDHLIVHSGGLIVVESKSVSGEVRISEQMQWTRAYKGGEQGMPSPLLQCERQALVLKENFRMYAAPSWAEIPIHTLVAVSDQGIVRYPSFDVPEVAKADQIPALILDLVAVAPPWLSGPEERLRMVSYLWSAIDEAENLVKLRRDPFTPAKEGPDAQLWHDIRLGDPDTLTAEEAYRQLERAAYAPAFEWLSTDEKILEPMRTFVDL